MNAMIRFIKNWWNIYAAPTQAFTDIKTSPPGSVFWIPMSVVVLVALISTLLTADLSASFTKEQISKSGKYSAEQKAVILERMESHKARPIMTVIPAAIMSVVSVMALGAIFYFVGNFFGGGKTTIWTMMSATAYIGLVDFLGAAIKLPMILTQHSLMVQTSLALLFPVQDLSNFWFRLAMQFDFFRIWKIVLFILAFKTIYKYSTVKSSVLVIPVWLVFIALSLLALSQAY